MVRNGFNKHIMRGKKERKTDDDFPEEIPEDAVRKEHTDERTD